MAKDITWNDKLAPRRRAAWLLLVKVDRVHVFDDADITGVAVVRGYDSEQCGVWSSTTYRLTLAAGVRSISGHSGFETGKFVEGLGRSLGISTPDTWSEVAEAIGVSVPAVMDFLRTWRPKAAARLDEVDEAMERLEDGVDDAERVTVSFGGPSNRAIRDGFWTDPQPIPGTDGEVYLMDEDAGWGIGNVAVRGVHGTVLDVTQRAGYHGGYVSVTVAVTDGEPEPAEPTVEPAVGTMAGILRDAGIQ